MNLTHCRLPQPSVPAVSAAHADSGGTHCGGGPGHRRARVLCPAQTGPSIDQLDQDANGVDDRLDWVALNVADPIGRVFLRLVLMVVLPLIVSALALAVVELGDLRRLGSVGLKTLLLTLVLSGIAVSIGVILVNVLRPGERLSESNRNALAAQYAHGAAETIAKSRQAKSVKDTLLDIIPENPLQEMVGALDGSSKGNGILAVMFFALVLGCRHVVRGRACRDARQVLRGHVCGLHAGD